MQLNSSMFAIKLVHLSSFSNYAGREPTPPGQQQLAVRCLKVFFSVNKIGAILDIYITNKCLFCRSEKASAIFSEIGKIGKIILLKSFLTHPHDFKNVQYHRRVHCPNNKENPLTTIAMDVSRES